MARKKANQLKITWKRSGIGRQQQHRRTIRALGLHRLNETIVKDDTPDVRGMVESVRFMLNVEEVEG